MQRMQVAVAGVEHVHRDQLVRVGDLVDAPQHLDELRARHDRVVQVVVGRDARDRAERRLAALPEQRALGVVGRDAHAAPRRGRRAIVAHGVDLRGDTAVEAVDLDEQHRLRVARVARADEVFDRGA